MLDNLFAKYRNSPNILGVLEILAAPIQDTSDAVDAFLAQIGIDDSEGPMLDALASWIGVRRLQAQETRLFWLCRDEDVGDDPGNEHGFATDDLTEGGYLSGDDGCPSKSDPGLYISYTEFREYIRAKAATFRRKATPDVIFEYLLMFGVRARLEEGERLLEIVPWSYGDLSLSVKSYIENSGFRPLGVTVEIAPQEHPDSEI